MINMKKLIQGILGLLFTMTLLQSCSKKDSNTTNPTTNPTTSVTTGTWVISTFSQGVEDKSSPFSGYVFTFSSGGVLKADKSGTVTTGSWSYTAATTDYYGNNPTKATYTLNMGTADPLKQLNRTWNIDAANTSTSKIALVSAEAQENMHLSFSKQ
jgi:hypothetical protein